MYVPTHEVGPNLKFFWEGKRRQEGLRLIGTVLIDNKLKGYYLFYLQNLD